MKVTNNYEIPATVIATGEHVMVNNPPSELDDNPMGWYTHMWHFTEDDRVFHDDELEFNKNMATIKSHTDLQQSKKLAEILPLESADNVIVSFGNRDGVKTVVMLFETLNIIKTPFSDIKEVIPCWSLAALLSVLPPFIEFKGDKYYLRFMKEYVEYANDEISITGRCLHTTGNNNLVDACYEMILKLNELNLL